MRNRGLAVLLACGGVGLLMLAAELLKTRGLAVALLCGSAGVSMLAAAMAGTRGFAVVLACGGAGFFIAATFVGVPKVVVLAAVFAAALAALWVHVAEGNGMVGACLLACTFLSPMLSLRFGSVTVAEPFFFAAVIFLLVDRSARPRTGPSVKPVLIGASLITLGGLIGSRFPPTGTVFSNPIGYQGAAFGFLPAGLGDAVRFSVWTIGVLALVAVWRPTRRDARYVAWAYLAGASVSAFVGLTGGGDQQHRVQGLGTHPVFFGLTSALAVLVALGLYLDGDRRLPLGLCGALCLYGVLASGTRSAGVIAGIGVALIFAAVRNRHVVGIALSGLLLVVVIALASPGVASNVPLFDRIGGGEESALSNAERANLADETIELIKTEWLHGVGLNYLIVPHNLLLGVIAGAGILGFAGFVMITSSLLHRLARMGRDPLRAGLIAGPCAFFLGSWITSVAWDRWMWLPLAAGLAFSTAPQDRGVRERAPKPRLTVAQPENA